jgi:hypothetical protein
MQNELCFKFFIRMKIDAFEGRVDVNTPQMKQEPVRRHSVVFKQLIDEAVHHNDEAMELR